MFKRTPCLLTTAFSTRAFQPRRFRQKISISDGFAWSLTSGETRAFKNSVQPIGRSYGLP
jgi:hypothetical protein